MWLLLANDYLRFCFSVFHMFLGVGAKNIDTPAYKITPSIKGDRRCIFVVNITSWDPGRDNWSIDKKIHKKTGKVVMNTNSSLFGDMVVWIDWVILNRFPDEMEWMITWEYPRTHIPTKHITTKTIAHADEAKEKQAFRESLDHINLRKLPLGGMGILHKKKRKSYEFKVMTIPVIYFCSYLSCSRLPKPNFSWLPL